MTTRPDFAELWESSTETLTPLEEWDWNARSVVLLLWHGEHPGEYLSHEMADQVLREAARTRPMPTIKATDLLANLLGPNPASSKP